MVNWIRAAFDCWTVPSTTKMGPIWSKRSVKRWDRSYKRALAAVNLKRDRLHPRLTMVERITRTLQGRENITIGGFQYWAVSRSFHWITKRKTRRWLKAHGVVLPKRNRHE